MEFDAFLSHSTKDKTMADAVCAKLEQAGIRCWIAPRDITPGKTWSGEIVKAIDHCKVMVLIFSLNSNESDQIIREVQMAVQCGKAILPLRIQDIQPSDSMAYFVNSVHWLDAITEPVEAHLDQLVVVVKSLLDSNAVPTKEKIAPVPEPPPPQPLNVTPKPTSTNWVPLVIGAGVVVLLVLAVVALFEVHASLALVKTRPAQPSPVSPSPAVRTPANIPASGDQSILGTWTLNTQLYGYPAVMTATYDSGGNYQIETVMTDSGTFQSANGQWTTTSSAGTVRQGTYQYAGPHTVKITGPLGMAFYSPVLPQSNLDPTNPVILGTWQATTHPSNGPPWTMTLTNNPDGSYTFKMEAMDRGTFTAGNGSLMLRSHVSGEITQCSFESLGDAQVSVTGPLGTATWTKR
jgi:hypothetical protein